MRNAIIAGAALAILVAGLGWHRSHRQPQSNGNAAGLNVAGQSGGNPAQAPRSTDTATNSVLKRMYSGERELLTVPEAVVRAHVESNGFSAESLLAAFQVASNRDYLLSAANKYPHDPRVQFAVLMNYELPEQRSRWLARFKQDASDSALPNEGGC